MGGVQPLHDFPKNRERLIAPRRFRKRDVELTGRVVEVFELIAARHKRMRRTDDAFIMNEFVRRFGLEPVTDAAIAKFAGAEGTTRFDKCLGFCVNGLTHTTMEQYAVV